MQGRAAAPALFVSLASLRVLKLALRDADVEERA